MHNEFFLAILADPYSNGINAYFIYVRIPFTNLRQLYAYMDMNLLVESSLLLSPWLLQGHNYTSMVISGKTN